MTTRADMVAAVRRIIARLEESAEILAYSSNPVDNRRGELWKSDAAALRAAAEALAAEEWRPVCEAKPHIQYLCGHAEKKWLRFGRIYPEGGNRWYYSGTNERSQYAQTRGDEPTHIRPLPAPPAEGGKR